MQETTNYNLKKPGMTDTVADSIPAYATNFDTIDALVKELDDGKVDKEAGKGLFSTAHANELTGGEETNLHKHAAADVNITDTGGYYDSTDVEGVLQEVGSELATHKADTMPHLIRDITNNKTYRYGYQMQNGITQFIYEEVV